MTEDKKISITKLPAGKHPLQIISTKLIVHPAGASQLQFTFKSADKNVEGEFKYNTHLFTL